MSEKKVVVSREYVINLRRTREVSRTKRAKYAVRLIRLFAARHMRVDVDKVKIDPSLSQVVWSRGIEKPPRRIGVLIEKLEDGTVLVRPRG